MRVRSVTIGARLGYPFDLGMFQTLGSFQRRARELFAEAGLEVQTIRLATQPFAEAVGARDRQAAVQYARDLEAACGNHGIDYCSIGTVVASQRGAVLGPIDAIPEIIRETQSVFASVLVAEAGLGINLAAIRRCAEVIAQVSTIEPGGFGNLRLAILANCGPGAPFFPASYHDGGRASFAVATESADLAVASFEGAKTVAQARDDLRTTIDNTCIQIERVSQVLANEYDMQYGGIDFSLAPYPETARSIGHAVECLGIDAFGANGTLFATALLTRAIRATKHKLCGFSGVMYPVLEDQTLAARSAEDLYGLDSLLLYSAVCGTGLDTVPLPGDVSVDELAAVLLDVATLSIAADKPLTARLMPIPGKQAGEMTEFDFAYFANGRILGVRGRGAGRVFQDEYIDL